MRKWRSKAQALKWVDRLPYGDHIYFGIQSTIGGLRNPDPFARFARLIEILDLSERNGLKPFELDVIEVGTGHIPRAPIGLWLCGARSIVTVDLHRRLSSALLAKTLNALANNAPRVRRALSPFADNPAFDERFAILQKLRSSPEEFLRTANIRYLAPADAARLPLEDASIGLHFSITTLEHIPPSDLRGILIEARRILRPTGLLVHHIDLSDHFQHSFPSISPVNFLRFSDAEWMRIADNQFAYCNRLRANAYRDLVLASGFEMLESRREYDPNALDYRLEANQLSPEFRMLSTQELTTLNYQFAAAPQ